MSREVDLAIQKFIGNWSLVEMTLIGDDGTKSYPNGEDARGLLYYTKDGIMSAQIGDPGREKSINPDYRYPTDAELRANYPQFISYFGKYKVYPDRSLVVHDIEMSLFPNWIGTKVKRYFEFSDSSNILTLKATPILSGGKNVIPTLIWKKI